MTEDHQVRAHVDRKHPTRRSMLRRALARIPGAASLYEVVRETPGSWLYRSPTLNWLADSTLTDQLPAPHRLFARYCRTQAGSPLAAETLLRTLIAVRSRVVASDDIVPLRTGGETVYLDLRDPRFLRVPSELAEVSGLLPHFLRSGDTFIDVGANHGTFSIAAARIVGAGGAVVAVEPQPRLAVAVERSLTLCGAPAEIHRVACGDSSERRDFFIPRATSGSAGVIRAYSAVSRHRRIGVDVFRLDDLLGDRVLPGRVVLKLDVEGSEPDVLRGASGLIRAKAPVVLIEINPRALDAAGGSRSALVQALLDLGYAQFATRDAPERERPLTLDVDETDLILMPPR